MEELILSPFCTVGAQAADKGQQKPEASTNIHRSGPATHLPWYPSMSLLIFGQMKVTTLSKGKYSFPLPLPLDISM